MPFVDDHHPHVSQLVACVGAREHQRQTFGRGGERGQHAPALPRTLGRRGIARAQPDAPRHRQRGDRGLQRAGRIRGERAHRRDPQDGERGGKRRFACGFIARVWLLAASGRAPRGPRRSRERRQCAEPHRPGLARARGRVQQAASAAPDFAPHLALEVERRPAAFARTSVRCVRRSVWPLPTCRRRRASVCTSAAASSLACAACVRGMRRGRGARRFSLDAADDAACAPSRSSSAFMPPPREKALQHGEHVGIFDRFVGAPAQHARKPHRDAQFVTRARLNALKPISNTSVGVTLRTGPNFSTVVFRTMASTLRISSSVRPEFAFAKGTSVRTPSASSYTAKVKSM